MHSEEGASDEAREWLGWLPERITHRPSRHFRDIVKRLLARETDVDANIAANLPEVRPLGLISYTYMTSAVAGRLAATGHSERAITVLNQALERLRADQAEDYLGRVRVDLAP